MSDYNRISGYVLKHCPMCGTDGISVDTHNNANGYRHTFRCQDCPVRMEFFSSSIAQAVDAWNRRYIGRATK